MPVFLLVRPVPVITNLSAQETSDSERQISAIAKQIILLIVFIIFSKSITEFTCERIVIFDPIANVDNAEVFSIIANNNALDTRIDGKLFAHHTA